VASGSAAAGATRRTPPATVPPRLVTPGAGGKRAVWIALALTAPVALRDGDEIRVGDFSLVFREVDAQPTVTHLA